nr:hypothetical protein [Buchnera aphidicola]
MNQIKILSSPHRINASKIVTIITVNVTCNVSLKFGHVISFVSCIALLVKIKNFFPDFVRNINPVLSIVRLVSSIF